MYNLQITILTNLQEHKNYAYIFVFNTMLRICIWVSRNVLFLMETVINFILVALMTRVGLAGKSVRN